METLHVQESSMLQEQLMPLKVVDYYTALAEPLREQRQLVHMKRVCIMGLAPASH